MRELGMFPLGTVLFPGVALPLHVFEPRYRRLTRDCLAGDREFGVVLIERGSEVGGGDLRTGIGTVARIVEAAELPDGRWALGAVGTAKLQVVEWLRDDPYPRAVVDEEVEDDLLDLGATRELLGRTVAALRRVLARKAELGEAAPPATFELGDDVRIGSYQVCALCPFGPADHHRLLAAPSASARLALAHDLLAEEEHVLDQKLHLDGPPAPAS